LLRIKSSPPQFPVRKCAVGRAARSAPGVPIQHRRRAFTLLEVLIVLVILATVLALFLPTFDRLHLEYRLRQGAQLVQAKMAGARVHAIDTGIAYQFRFEPGGQRFLVIPDDLQALVAPASGTGATPGAPLAPRIPKFLGRLPSTKAAFDPASTGGSMGQQLPTEWLSGISNAGDLTNVTWSAPILFHADGSATTAQIVISDKKSRSVVVSVRALTGGVSVSNIEKGGPTR